jgi:hypothetical protein
MKWKKSILEGKPVRIILSAFPFLYAVITFIRVIGNTFWLDDYGWVSNAMRTTRDISYLLQPMAGFFRPVVNGIFVVNFWMFGLDPAGYYVANILIHLVNIALVFVLVYRLSKERFFIAWFASLLFAGTFGNYGEAVIWISGCTELIATTFYLLTLMYHWSFLNTRKVRDYVLAFLCFLMSLLSKESTISLLPVLILLDWFTSRDGPRERILSISRFKKYIPFAALLLPYLWYEVQLQQSNYVVYEDHYRIGWHVIPNVLEYLGLMVVPITSRSTIIQIPTAASFASLALGVGQRVIQFGLLVLWVFLVIKNCYSLTRFSILWMLFSILPYAFFAWKTTVRYLYIPSIGFAIAVAVLLDVLIRWLKENEKQKWIWIIGGGVVIALGIQWMVVSYLIGQWGVMQSQQDAAAYESLVNLAKTLGY